jgi:pyruvate/2-oxoglutarate dehydrogenase complex dihydrolipoamide dehydrogenase (E3) component
MGLVWLTLIGVLHLIVGHPGIIQLSDDEINKLFDEEEQRREAMGTKTIKIELRYNSESETDKVMRQVTRECARTLMASAMLVSNGRAPQIAVTCEDIFAADQTKIDLMLDETDEPSPELEQVGEGA